MKKNIVLLTFLLCSLSLFADSYIDSLQAVIESLPFSYEKADKIWDLALYQSNESNQPQDAIENYSKASEMFVEIDSLSQAFKTNGSIINVAFNNPEYYDYSKEAFTKQLSFFENKELQKYKGDMLVFFLRHVTNAYLLKEMDYLKECLLLVEPYFKDNEYDYIKIDFDYISILTTSFFNGEQAALNQSMEVYDRLESGKYNLVFGKKQSMRVKLLSLMQNYHYYRGNIEQSNQLLDQAMFIAKDTYQNHPDSLSSMDKINFKVDITKIMTLKVDNIPIIEENLVDIEKDYLEVNDFSKSFDEERELNNFVKIAHAYDIVYSGNHEKIPYYLNLVEKDFELLKNPVYLTNYQLTKARYMLNKKEYDQANSLFLKVEDFIDKTNQYWLKLNYIMERSRYYFEMGDPKTGYQMITTFYKTIDKDFSTDIAEKTAQLNNLLNTQRLQSDNLTLEKELEINSLKNSRSNLIIIIITISLAFAVIFLINNIIMRNKLQKALKKQSEELQQEIISNRKKAEELIISEKLSTTGQIASSIAHEIKNPLTNIITASKLLSTAKTPDMIDKYFEICERNSWLAIDKVNALLEYAKQTKMNYTESSLRTILKDAINLAKGSLEKYEVEANLIYKTYDDVIRVDRKEFTGALVNLILNSVQAMEEKKENKHIDLILSKEDNEFIIEISDNGSGIPAETIPKVFTPFFTSKESGTGLGLSYAQKVVIEHSGHISIKSELDRGTQVLIKLPVNS